MAINNRSGGTLRTDYETDKARLDDFPVMESDQGILLHRLIKAAGDGLYRDGEQEGSLRPLLENHVLTVLVDIRRKRLSGYGDTFANARGTTGQIRYTGKLQEDIKGWMVRLETYLHNVWLKGGHNSTAAKVARELYDRLNKSLPKENETDKRSYSRMLHTLTSIQRNADYYLEQAEDSGDTDGALALLLVYLKNYGSVAKAFNKRLGVLPELYRRDILHVASQQAVQDSTYLVIASAIGKSGFTIPKAQPFLAGQNAKGEDLVYQTVKEEYISPMRCEAVNAVSVLPTGIYTQTVPFKGVTTGETLFDKAHVMDMAIGWQLESPMFVLDEGERVVSIHFRLTEDSILPENIPSGSFILQVSTADGWMKQKRNCYIKDHLFCFDFTMAHDGAVPTSCAEDIHGTVTEYPVIRILTNNTACPYSWAKKMNFDLVRVETRVSGIRNFTFYNELGGVDTSQPFSPFGIQAERGAWFLFGNEEMGLKTLQEVRLKGRWQKLSEAELEFNKIYKDYETESGKAVSADSFMLSTEYQEDGRWKSCQNGTQHLLVPDNHEDRSLTRAEVVFDFALQTSQTTSSDNVPLLYEYSRDKEGFFRVTLQAPDIGFGTNAYRKLFTDMMIYNSRCKEKERKPLPVEPTVPLLADVELSYIAAEETSVAEMKDSSIRLSRITGVAEQNLFPIDGKTAQLFLPTVPSEYLLYFAFSQVNGEQSVRMYLDMVLPQEKIPLYNPDPGMNVKLTWEFWSRNGWKSLSEDAICTEETNGLTQSGFIEITLPEKLNDSHTDEQGRMWLRAALVPDYIGEKAGEEFNVSACLALRGVWMNCIKVTAQNGDGSPLPAGTIQDMAEKDERIESIVQPLNGFGGRSAETERVAAIHQSSRFGTRHRALTMKDYELLVVEYFPEVDKVQCIPIVRGKGASEICLVVFSRAEDSCYCLSPAWKLAEIQRLISRYAPPFVILRIMNPVYEEIQVQCKAVLWDKVQDKGKVIRQLMVLAQDYIAPWYRKKEIPELRQHYSYKELYARMVNHEALMKLVSLEVKGKSLSRMDTDTENMKFEGKYPWSVLLPKIEIELLSSHDGIDAAEIGGNFIIG